MVIASSTDDAETKEAAITETSARTNKISVNKNKEDSCETQVDKVAKVRIFKTAGNATSKVAEAFSNKPMLLLPQVLTVSGQTRLKMT